MFRFLWLVLFAGCSTSGLEEKLEIDTGSAASSGTPDGAGSGPGGGDGSGATTDGDCDPEAIDCADPACASLCDADADGFVAVTLGGDDCDDADAAVHPGATEICNGLDDDCDDAVDDADSSIDPGSQSTWFPDGDGDGVGREADAVRTCDTSPPDGHVATPGDCDDADPSVTEGAQWVIDDDGDGVGAGVVEEACEPPSERHVPAALGEDCDDADRSVYPGASEVCGDGVDQDCSGADAVDCLPDTCDDASAAPWTAPGVYMDDATGLADDLSPVGVCIPSEAAGSDVMYPVEVGPYEVLTATVTGDRPAVYVMQDCTDEATCVAGGSDAAVAEVVWYNPRDVAQAVTLVVDHRDSGGPYTLELSVTAAPARMALEPADSCADLLPGLALTTGSYRYEGSLVAYGADFTPDASCTGYAARGADAAVPIRLEPGESIAVDYTNAADTSVYILSDCADVDTCVVGADDTFGGETESLALTNTTGAVLEATLVLDAYTGGGAWELDVTID